jgi:hypothetical protein
VTSVVTVTYVCVGLIIYTYMCVCKHVISVICVICNDIMFKRKKSFKMMCLQVLIRVT